MGKVSKILLVLLPFLIIAFLVFYLKSSEKLDNSNFSWQVNIPISKTYSEELFENHKGKLFSYTYSDHDKVSKKGIVVRDARSGETLWEKKASIIKAFSSDQNVFLLMSNWHVKALNIQNGDARWEQPDARVTEIMGFSNGVLYLANASGTVDTDNYFYGVDAGNGKILWRIVIRGAYVPSYSSFDETGIYIYATDRSGSYLNAYNKNGKIRWKVEASGMGQISISKNELSFIDEDYVGSKREGNQIVLIPERKFIILDRKTGKVLFSVKASGGLLYDNVVYISLFENNSFVVSSRQLGNPKLFGTITLPIDKSMPAGVSELGENMLITVGKTYYSVKAKSLQKNWQYEKKGAEVSRVLKTKESILLGSIVPSNDGAYADQLLILDKNGQEEKTFQLPIYIENIPGTIQGDDGIFISTGKSIFKLKI